MRDAMGDAMGDMMRKYLLPPILAGGLSLLAMDASWALTAYVVDFSGDDGAFAIDPSTIQDGSPGQRSAEALNVLADHDVHIAKIEFDCAGRHVRTLSEKLYHAEETGLNFTSDLGSADSEPVAHGTIMEAVFTFVCGWPQVSSDAVKIEPDLPDMPRLVIYLSDKVMEAD